LYKRVLLTFRALIIITLFLFTEANNPENTKLTHSNWTLPTTATNFIGEEDTNQVHSSHTMTTARYLTSSADSTDSTETEQCSSQNIFLIWLDSGIDESNNNFTNYITHLQHIIKNINTFTDPKLCVDFLSHIENEKVYMIVSGSLGQQIIPEIHAMSPLDSVYVFCSNKAHHEQWTKGWAKIKGIFTEISPIFILIEKAVRESDQDSVSVGVVAVERESKQNLNEIDQSFMYTQILKEILFEIDYNIESIKDFVIYCREKYRDDCIELENIAKFEKEYRPEKAIWWYTYECFLYRMLNRVLRNQEVSIIIKLGFFIRDLHRQLEILHAQQYGKQQSHLLTLYRGQGVAISDFEKLLKTPGGLLSFNNFLSTSEDSKVSLQFGKGGKAKPGFVRILFEMTVSSSISSSPFALLDEVSFFKDTEKEILFSAHTVFRIGEIVPMDEKKLQWLVKLTLTSDNNTQLNEFTQRLREETAGTTGWFRLGILLIKIAEYGKAEELYQELLARHSSDEIEKAHIYHQLGWTKRKRCDYVEALSYYEKALEIRQNKLPSIHPDLALSYNNIGDVYKGLGENEKALWCYEKALQMRQKLLPPNHPDLATSLNNIGDLYNDMTEYSKALSFYEKALQMRQKCLPSNHPDLATSYNNIGNAYCNIGEYSQALPCYDKALEISEKTLPPYHPDLASFYSNFGFIFDQIGDYTKALSYYEKALDIWLKSFDLNHPTLITAYNNIGILYLSMGEYSQALSYCEKALAVCQNSRSPNHPDFATTYNNIGQVYFHIGEYSKALSYYEQDLEISKNVLPSNHIDLAVSYNSIGNMHYHMGEYSNALSNYQKALEICQESLPANHTHIAACYKNIGHVHKSLADYSKASFYHQQALEIYQKSVPENHPSLATSYNNIGLVDFSMGEYFKALSSFEKALQIRENALTPNHPDFATSYNSIGDVFNSIGEYSKARSYYKKTYEVYEKMLPASHPNVAIYYNNIGNVYYNIYDYPWALSSYKKAFEIRQNVLSPNHPDLATTYNSIGNVYKGMGEYTTALSFYERAIAGAQHSLPEAHPDFQMYKQNFEDLRKL
jgi:tetratricopeptide (TPR) repeat protein